MKKPFKVLATSSLLLMLAACNTNNNAAYDALNPGEDVTNVSYDRRGDNLGDAFRLRNGNDTAEELNTKNVNYRGGTAGTAARNRNNDANNFDYDGDNGDGGFDIAYNNRRGSSNELAGNMSDISADFTTINSQNYPHTRAFQIQDAKFGYVALNPQGKQITLPDLQSITEQFARRYQMQMPGQGGQGGQAGMQPPQWQQPNAGQVQRPTEQLPQQQPVQPQRPTVQQPTAKAPAPAPAQPKPTQPAAKAPAPAAKAPVTQGISATEQKVIELTNAERRKAGIKDLIGDSKLSSVARTKSNDMQSKGYFSHTSPTYGSPFDMMRDFGVTYSTAGENIAQGQRTPEEVVRAWMNSEGHRKNIMNPAFTHIGVGHDTTGNHWTQMFIGK